MDCGHRPVGGGAHARGVRGEARPRLCARAGASPSPARISHMLNLREYRSTADRLADHLPWAALIAPGAVPNKEDRTSDEEGKRVSCSVDPRGRRIIKKKNKNKH